MLLISGQIENVTTRKDKTLKLTIGTNELNPEQVKELIIFNQHFVWIALKTEEFRQAEQDVVDNISCDIEISSLKTPSQRLRGVFYKLFSQDNKGYDSFAMYYEVEMEKLIQNFKNKIE